MAKVNNKDLTRGELVEFLQVLKEQVYRLWQIWDCFTGSRLPLFTR